MTLLQKFFHSRKFWAFATGLVTLLGASLEDGVFSAQETQAISALVIGYVFSIAFEDGMSRSNSGPVQVGQADTVNIEEAKQP